MSMHQKIDLTQVEEIKAQFFKHYTQIDRDLLYHVTMMQLHALSKVDWVEYNEQRYCNKIVPLDEVVYIPKLYPVPKPFKSWNELYVIVFGGLQDHEFEPKEYKMDYVVKHVYSPDAIDANNDRLVWEIKGVIAAQADARKYVETAKLNDVHFIFVFERKGLPMPFQRKRKDGTKMTHEEWCRKNGFSFTYLYEVEEWKKGDEYKKLLEFGKDKGSLIDQLSK